MRDAHRRITGTARCDAHRPFMKRTVWLIVLGIVAFATIVIARLPASWVVPVVPAPPASSPSPISLSPPGAAASANDVGCVETEGTIWNGSCMGLVAGRQAIGDLSWELHPLRLLDAKLDGDIVLTSSTGNLRGSVEIGFGKVVTARNVHANLTIDPRLIPQLPPNLRDVRGTLNAQITLLRFQANTIRTLEGTVEVHDMQEGSGSAAEQYGSYALSFPGGGGPPVGQLRDLGGPLAVEGSVRLLPGPGFEAQGLVAPRPTASQKLADDLRYLGSPDPQGRRPFMLEISF